MIFEYLKVKPGYLYNLLFSRKNINRIIIIQLQSKLVAVDYEFKQRKKYKILSWYELSVSMINSHTLDFVKKRSVYKLE